MAETAISGARRFGAARPNQRDPLVARLLGPGKPFVLETVTVAGVPQQVFQGAARTLGALLAKAAAASGSRTMVVHGDAALSYDDVFRRAASLGQALRGRYGVTRGTRVALACGNRAEFVVALIAIIASGGVAALINSRGVAEEILHAARTAGCDLAIMDAERAGAVAASGADPAWPRIVIGAAPDGAPPDGACADLLRPGQDAAFEALTAADAAFAPLPMAPEDGAIILFTSGTTGHPKGALLSHGAIAHAIALSRFMGALQDLRYEEEVGAPVPHARRSMASPALVLTPMFHLTGVLPILRGAAMGATIHIVGKWNVDTAFDMVETSGLSRIAFVPTMLFDMLASPRATPETLAAIRNLAYGGAPINLTLVDEVHRRMPHCLITNTYGQTENTGWACSLSGRPYLAHPQSCGWACPTIDVSVRRDDGTECALEEPGEIWVRSPSVMTEYVGDAQATEAALVEGWCATGDIGTVDAAGLFTILDRRKNMVISGGENTYCAEVERVLQDHPAVREAIAYGVPDPRLGERLLATVLVRPESGLTAAALLAYCRDRLALYKTPRELRLTAEPLPRTASGKIDRAGFLRTLR